MPIIARALDTCPKCKNAPFGNVSIHNNQIFQACAKCGFRNHVSLPRLRKVVIYLDQFFHSIVFKGQPGSLSSLASRLESLASMQLIVCPLSSMHELETFAWGDTRSQDLYKFIEQTSRGHDFNPTYQIRKSQLRRAFKAFCSGESVDTINYFDAEDALPKTVHEWDDYFYVSTGPYPIDRDRIRKSKQESGPAFASLFEDWRREPPEGQSFEKDYRAEINAESNRLWRCYWAYAFAMVSPHPTSFLEQPIEASFVESLLRFDDKTMDAESRIKRIAAFLRSTHFGSVPWIDLSARIFATLKKQVRTGSHANRDKIGNRFSGFFQDVEIVTSYAPYCDAMLLDRAMHNMLLDRQTGFASLKGVKFFSTSNLDEFNTFLDGIEQTKPPDLHEALGLWMGASLST